MRANGGEAVITRAARVRAPIAVSAPCAGAALDTDTPRSSAPPWSRLLSACDTAIVIALLMLYALVQKSTSFLIIFIACC